MFDNLSRIAQPIVIFDSLPRLYQRIEYTIHIRTSFLFCKNWNINLNVNFIFTQIIFVTYIYRFIAAYLKFMSVFTFRLFNNSS